jgi:Flp pilus assembly secretin CpaC
MANRKFTCTATLSALFVFAGLAQIGPAVAAEARTPIIQVAASEASSRSLALGIGKSVAIDLPADIKDVLVADPKVANAVVRSSRRVYTLASPSDRPIFSFSTPMAGRLPALILRSNVISTAFVPLSNKQYRTPTSALKGSATV